MMNIRTFVKYSTSRLRKILEIYVQVHFRSVIELGRNDKEKKLYKN